MRDREQYADFQARTVCLKLWGNLLESRSNTPPPVSQHVEARGRHYISFSVTLHLRQGLLLNPELTSWLGWPPVSPGSAFCLFSSGVFSCSQLLCGYRGPHSGPHSVKAGTLTHPQPLEKNPRVGEYSSNLASLTWEEN